MVSFVEILNRVQNDGKCLNVGWDSVSSMEWQKWDGMTESVWILNRV